MYIFVFASALCDFRYITKHICHLSSNELQLQTCSSPLSAQISMILQLSDKISIGTVFMFDVCGFIIQICGWLFKNFLWGFQCNINELYHQLRKNKMNRLMRTLSNSSNPHWSNGLPNAACWEDCREHIKGRQADQGDYRLTEHGWVGGCVCVRVCVRRPM